MTRPLSAYARRIERALARGKSLQQARGHKPREHVDRAAREREEHGLSNYDERAIRNFVRHSFDPKGVKRADPEEFIEHFREVGFEKFQHYRAVWWKARRRYLGEVKVNPGLAGGKGRKAARQASGGGSGGGGGAGGGYGGFGEDEDLGYDYLDDLAEDADVADESWLYYH
jgi:hypothetical protein